MVGVERGLDGAGQNVNNADRQLDISIQTNKPTSKTNSRIDTEQRKTKKHTNKQTREHTQRCVHLSEKKRKKESEKKKERKEQRRKEKKEKRERQK